MNNIIPSNTVSMTSLEVVDLINRFRELEGSRKKLVHENFLKKCRKELETMESLGLIGAVNIYGTNYKDKQGKIRPCFKLDKYAVLQMTMSESVYVRAKIIEYIQSLENKLTTITLTAALEKKDEEIKRLENLIGLRAKDKFNYGKIIKEHLGIKKANDDYNAIKYMFFYELDVTKWEDITYSRDNVVLLKQICNDYKPHKKLF